MTYKPIMPMVIIVPILVFILGVCIYSIVKRKSEKLDKALAIGRISVIIILMFFINLRPMRKVYDMQVEMKNIDVLIVIIAMTDIMAYVKMMIWTCVTDV